MEYMSKVENNAFNLTLTDIPYGEVNRDSNGLRNLDKNIADVMTFKLNDFLNEVYRVTEGTIIIFCFSNRILCGINGDFYEHNPDGSIKYKKNGEPKKMSSAKCYAWFVWEVGNYSNKPVIDWIN